MSRSQAHHFLFIQNFLNTRKRKTEYEIMRTQTYYLTQIHLDKKTTPQKLMPFPWDNEGDKKVEPIVQDEEVFEGFEKMFANLKKK